MLLKIITPERIVVSEEVYEVTLMTEEGQISILQHHIPLITNLKAGELKYKKEKDGPEFYLALAGGFAEVKSDNSLTVLADAAERPEEIDLDRVARAKELAAKTMQTAQVQNDQEYALVAAALERALNREKISKKYRNLPV